MALGWPGCDTFPTAMARKCSIGSLKFSEVIAFFDCIAEEQKRVFHLNMYEKSIVIHNSEYSNMRRKESIINYDLD